MLRYLRLYGYFLRFSFSRAMEFRLDFCFRIGMDMIWYAVNLAFFWALHRHTTLLGGWSIDQTLVFAGGVFVSDAIYMTMFSNNMWWLPFFINRGDLDYYLARPVSSLFFVSLREFAANSFVNLLMAVAILTWTLARYPQALGLGSIGIYLALLACGVVIHYSLNMLFLIPTFWTHSASGLREVFFSMSESVTRPHGIFRGWARRILVSVLPFSLIASFPARALFEGPSLGLPVHVVGVAAAAIAAVAIFWRVGLRSYASASS